MNNYDQWLNSNNPIDLEHEEERREEEKRELLLDDLAGFDTEEEIQDYLSENRTSKTQEIDQPFVVDGQFWEAENDILRHEQIST